MNAKYYLTIKNEQKKETINKKLAKKMHHLL